MPFYKFEKNDLFFNTIKAYPQVEFFIYDKAIYRDRKIPEAGSFADPITHVPNGHVSLHELNIDRPAASLIYPFIVKGGSLSSFKTTTVADFNANSLYGATINGTYPLSASISVDRRSGTNRRIKALKNTINHYRPISQHYEFSSSVVARDFASLSDINLISIPSIFYGSSIKKGTVDLKFYISGTLTAQLKDEKQNGELVQVAPAGSLGSGSVAGITLYNEGFIILTGSWSLHSSHTEKYDETASAVSPKWIYFATTGSSTSGTNVPSSSFAMNFSGTSHIQTITMFAHARKGELNHSNNPTYIKSGSATYLNVNTGSTNRYIESDQIEIKNIVSASYAAPTGSFEKTTYISKIGIYDKDRNLIAITKMATPIKKTSNREFKFKLKLDI